MKTFCRADSSGEVENLFTNLRRPGLIKKMHPRPLPPTRSSTKIWRHRHLVFLANKLNFVEKITSALPPAFANFAWFSQIEGAFQMQAKPTSRL